jgi:DtxR family Mn-dependent transcriptional regulator
MDELLGYPKIDPHGSPIPDRHGKMQWQHHAKLNECKAGTTVQFVGIMNSSDDFLRFLNSKELKLGTKVTILEIEDFDGSMTVAYDKRKKEIFSRTVAERLLVEK